MDIKEFNERFTQLEDRYYQDRQELEGELDDWIGTQWPLYKSGRFSIGFEQWPCEDSPIGICIYNDFEDPAHDFCIFCQEPEERK